jgi:hypothetical protein
MALTEANELKVCKILGVLYQDLEYQLALLSTDFTSERQSQVETELDRWDAGAGTKFTKIKANERNFGAEIDPEREKNDIRKNIAYLLERPDWAGGSSSRIVRC